MQWPDFDRIKNFASITGAWIETALPDPEYDAQCFASITGAWIETWQAIELVKPLLSRPSRARGLKQPITSFKPVLIFASITGAWIETVHRVIQVGNLGFASITGANFLILSTSGHCTVSINAPVMDAKTLY